MSALAVKGRIWKFGDSIDSGNIDGVMSGVDPEFKNKVKPGDILIAGKFFGMGGVYSKDLIQRYLKTGVQFMLGGADIAFMLDGAKARREMIRGVT